MLLILLSDREAASLIPLSFLRCKAEVMVNIFKKVIAFKYHPLKKPGTVIKFVQTAAVVLLILRQ